MRKTVEVVDGFFRNPARVRRMALDAEWVQPDAADAGDCDARTREAVADAEATGRLAALLGVDGRTPVKPVAGFFAFVGDGAQDRLAPHVDGHAWAAVVDLSLPDRFESGMAFYRPAARDGAGSTGGADEPGVHGQRHPDGWEETMYVPMRFNRMVLFPASELAHRPLGFGASPAGGRIAQVFLFDELAHTAGGA